MHGGNTWRGAEEEEEKAEHEEAGEREADRQKSRRKAGKVICWSEHEQDASSGNIT